MSTPLRQHVLACKDEGSLPMCMQSVRALSGWMTWFTYGDWQFYILSDTASEAWAPSSA